MTPFHVQCQTCQAFLRVTKPEAIGLILACPKCHGMVGVQPPPDWQDPTNVGQSSNEASAAPAHPVPPVLREPVAGSRWLVPSFAAGALLCAGLLSWAVWSHLREPDRAEPLPSVATANPEPAKEPPLRADETLDPAAVAEEPRAVKEQIPPAPQPLRIEPAQLIAKQQAPQAVIPAPVLEPGPMPSPPLSEQAPSEPAPPKSKLVLKPEQTPPANPEPPLFARGPEVNPPNATQAAPPAETDEQPVFTPPPEAPSPALAPVNPPQPAAAPLPRTPLRAVKSKNLDLLLTSISYERVPLHAFLREMSELADTEIGIDDETLSRSGWRLTTPIRIQLDNVTIRGALEAALRPLELDLIVKENFLWIGHTAAGDVTHLTRYPIDDLVSKDSPDTAAAALAEQTKRLVAPDRWETAKFETVPGAFLVTQTAAVHDELIVWFEKLRIARGLPLRTKYDPANPQLRRFAPQRFALASRWQLAEPLLAKPVTASFLQADSLGEILDALRRQSQAVLTWDLPALDTAGLSPDTLATLVVRETRFETALEQLLAPLGLVAIPVDEVSLLITTRTAAAQRPLIERYPLGPLAEQRRWGADEAEIVAGFRQEIAAYGVELPESVRLTWDAASRTLAVNASPLIHRAVNKFLADLQQKPVAATALIKK